MQPSSFCALSTHNSHHELFGLLLSLSIHHRGAKMYCAVDSKTRAAIKSYTPDIRLNIVWITNLDKYAGKNRTQMERENVWSDFQMEKANVIAKALEHEPDTMFMDADIVVLAKIDDIDNTKQVGVSPHYIKKSSTDRFGYYNGGMLWTKDRTVPEKWKEFTKTSRYYDQASIEELSKTYTFFEFGLHHNFGQFRVSHNQKQRLPLVKGGDIVVNNKKLTTVHTHFNRSYSLNPLIKKLLRDTKNYKLLSIIRRIEKHKWTITMPKQPSSGIWNHKNDSFRELVFMLGEKNDDVEVKTGGDCHILFEPCTLLYDRPTLQWAKQMGNPLLTLVGNGSVKDEVVPIQKRLNTGNVSPWIFWPRHPRQLEEVLQNNEWLDYAERKTGSVFIGNFHTAPQSKHRNDKTDWASVIDVYHCSQGNTHRFNQKEYLLQLRNSRYGLCLRGFGSKCHREVELMAFGTVPVVTNAVSISDYFDKPLENVHYLVANSPSEFAEKLANVDKNTWRKMSKNCSEWYERNVLSPNCWRNTLEYVLYENV